jgi:hypothetical protein
MYRIIIWTFGPPSISIIMLIIFWNFYWRFHFIWRGNKKPRLKAYICKGCEGYGEQWYDPDYERMMPVPVKNRPMANTEICKICNGIGHHWKSAS